MKKHILSITFICIITSSFCQSSTPYDSSFKELYKTLALHPWYRNGRGIIHDSVIKRWDKDINIFIDGGDNKERKEIITKLKNVIAAISPSLNNKIKISFVDDKSSANYLIDLTFIGRSGWYLKWDRLDNIYSCRMLINTNVIFNRDEQAAIAAHYFLKSLGDFVLRKDVPDVVANMRLWRQDINDLDLRILKLHYSDNIRTGMTEKDIDKFFSNHNN